MKKQRTPEMIMREIRNLLGELGSVIGNSPKGKILQGNTTQSLDPRHSGAVGGIRLLCTEGFLVEPRTVSQVDQELRKSGYIYRREVISVALLRFVRQGILTRLPEDGTWKYVLRK